MAIVANRARPQDGIDVPYTTPNRSATNASVPLYAGEVIYDTALKTCIVGLSNTASGLGIVLLWLGSSALV